VVRNNWYTENYTDDVRRAGASGLIAAAVKTGKVASASRSDYAEAAVRVLIGETQAGKVYEFTGSRAWDYAELAATAAELLGRPVSFKSLPATERRQGLMAAGLPEGIADFILSLDLGIEAGTLAEARGDLAAILGRQPCSLKEGLREALG
jgi:NAD(P)H dehydrogenase (quinone)